MLLKGDGAASEVGGDMRRGSAIDNCGLLPPGDVLNGEMLLKLDMKILFSSDEERWWRPPTPPLPPPPVLIIFCDFLSLFGKCVAVEDMEVEGDNGSVVEAAAAEFGPDDLPGSLRLEDTP